MLSHKIDGEHPASYSDLLLAAWKLERWAEARDSLLLKTTIIKGSNVSCPQALGNLFPSRKLQGNHNFIAQSAMVESVGTEGDYAAGPEWEEEVESLEDCQKDLGKVTRKVSLNAKEGMMKGSWAPQKPVVTQLASWDEAPRA